MALRQLSLTDFRNLHSTTLDLDPAFNLILGANGAGKTSLLEAIHIISQGQSFKTRSLEQCIQHGKQSFLIFSRFDDYKAGISKTTTDSQIRLNNQTITRLSELAEKTPIRIINADSFKLVEGSPAVKREYIDWSVFHVEHTYHDLWIDYRHALKQRNALLKARQPYKQLDYWDDFLADKNQLIYEFRAKYIKLLSASISAELKRLVDDLHITIEYRPGWNTEHSYEQLLRQQRDKDLRYGFTHSGIHRDDIKIFADGVPIGQALSRGQLKRLSISLILAQIILLRQMTGKSMILLIDDINAELDSTALELIMQILSGLDLQIFITSINGLPEQLAQSKEYKMFHVEHGMIRVAKSS
ncbi:MAG: DNA replication/repair protein RecF [Gammaproteobacteria bacterium]|nr:DNA replication/repair protein RecF [Gammaproteobacteria bacterium]